MKILLFVIFLSLSLDSYSQNFRDSTRFFVLNLMSNNQFRLIQYYNSEDTIPFSSGFYRIDHDTLVCFPADFYSPDSSWADSDTANFKFYFYEKNPSGNPRRIKYSTAYDTKKRKHYSDSMEVMKIKKCKLKDNFLFLEAREQSVIFYRLYFSSSTTLNCFSFLVEEKDRRLYMIKEPLKFRVSSKDSSGIKILEFLNPKALGELSSWFFQDAFHTPIFLHKN
jgi:hypothetical protein